jgi:hypothetical protein
MRLFSVVAMLLAAATAQQSTVKPKSEPTKKTSVTEFDFSGCDVVRLSMPLHRLEIREGNVEAYWFRRYKAVTPMSITCFTETER